MATKRLTKLSTLLLTIALASVALAQDFDLSWHTIDGGGGYSAGGDFELEGTTGQCDAGYLTGGDFELSGGFWIAPTAGACACTADLNGDGWRGGDDIQGFVDCLVSNGTNCPCADLDGNGLLEMADISLFVDALLLGTPCP